MRRLVLAEQRARCVLLTADGRSCCSHSTSHRLVASYSSRIAIFCLPHLYSTPRRNIAIMFGMEKTTMLWLPMAKTFEDTFILFARIDERDRRIDGRTDRQTDTAWRHIRRACIASRSKIWCLSTYRFGSTPKCKHFYRVTPCSCLPCLVNIRERIHEIWDI